MPSAITGNVLGPASSSSAGLVTTAAQTFAGKKTLDGGAAIKGDTSGSAIAAGYVGQIITSSGTRTFSGNSANLWYVGTLSTGSGITLTAGIWFVAFSVITTYTSGTNTVGGVILTTDTVDGGPTNNTSSTLTTTSAFLGNLNGTTTLGPQSQGFGILNLSGTTTYTCKVLTNTSNFTGSYSCSFFAVRIA